MITFMFNKLYYVPCNKIDVRPIICHMNHMSYIYFRQNNTIYHRFHNNSMLL